jgi:hypothetical protein
MNSPKYINQQDMTKALRILLMILCVTPTLAQSRTGYLTDDGGWCWFSDPRAIMVDNQIFTGWVKSNGTIEAASFDFESGVTKTAEIHYRLEKDDHNNPAFVLAGNGNLIAMYTRHSQKDLFISMVNDYKSDFDFEGAQMIHPISQEELSKFPRETVTYANPYRLEAEDNRIYCFGRWTGFKPNIMWSDDHGVTWSKSRVFITNYPFNSNNRPYVKYFSDGRSKIHIVFTDGHPNVEPTNSVYYAYYEGGNFFKADGTLICSLNDAPFEPKDASIVYRATTKEGRAWIADIGQDGDGHPVLLYTKTPQENDHRYWYARFVDNRWISHEICKSGGWFPQTREGEEERETYYFGGLTLHPENENIVYLSREVNDIFEIERWETADLGLTWTRTPITSNSKYDNVRPYIPRGLRKDQNEVVLWMENEYYIHFTNYNSGIRYYIYR